MPSDLIIRHVARQDFEKWLPLWDGYNAFYGRAGSTALDPEVTKTTWQRFFDAYEPVHGLVADSGGAFDVWLLAGIRGLQECRQIERRTGLSGRFAIVNTKNVVLVAGGHERRRADPHGGGRVAGPLVDDS